MKNKSDAFDKFKTLKLFVKNQTNRKLKVLRTDNGLEFCTESFNYFCRENGIEKHRTVTNTPQQYGVA